MTQKIAILSTIAKTLLSYVFATKACIDDRKKPVKQQYLIPTSSQYCELGPLTAKIGSGV